MQPEELLQLSRWQTKVRWNRLQHGCAHGDYLRAFQRECASTPREGGITGRNGVSAPIHVGAIRQSDDEPIPIRKGAYGSRVGPTGTTSHMFEKRIRGVALAGDRG